MSRRSDGRKTSIPIVLSLVALGAAVTVVARKKGYSGIGGDTIVRCTKGHLFTTIWIPGGSLKAIRLGWKRFQYCPVGKHWAMVTPVKDSELTEDERAFALDHHDLRIP
jgi:hypothetical protein